MVIGITGTRTNQPQLRSAIHTLLLLVPAGSTVVTGCCPTGADKAVRDHFPHCQGGTWFPCANPTPAHTRLIVYNALNRNPAALRERTISLVASVPLLVAFPGSPSYPHSGTWLSVFTAAVSCTCAPYVVHWGMQVNELPTCRGIISWRSSALPGPLGPMVEYPVAVPVLSSYSLFQENRG
jgi:hypothetical protein